MKPVNLVPKGSAVAAGPAEPAKLSMGVVGGIAGGSILAVVLAGYFAFSRVDSIKSETAQAQAAQAAADTKAQQVKASAQNIAKPVTDNDKQLAQSEEQMLVSAFSERYNYVEMTRELQGIMAGTGGWYSSVKVNTGAAAADASSTAGVKIEGYLPTVELAGGFAKRVRGTHSFSNAEGIKLDSVKMLSVYTKKPTTYWHFIVTADFDDNIAPAAPTASSSTTGTPVASTGTTVASGDGTLSLSLDANPVPTKSAAQVKAEKAAAAKKAADAAAKAAKAAQPKNPFDEAAGAVAGGAS
ncbi:MAG: hypothetical protein JWN72_1452 [Thermoleophilia bacterium]|nr:hypothetical protein [Thermoleophilia bacterium]